MHLGLLLLGEHQPERLIGLARVAEAHGLNHLWYTDEKFFRDPYVSLTHVASYTSRIALGTCVTDPYSRHPALIAMAMGTLAELAPNRAILGIGAGISGLGAMRIERRKPVATLRAAVEMIRQLWAGNAVTRQGEVFSLHDAELNFRPPAPIPIYIASSGRQMLRLAGEIADGILLGDLASPRVVALALQHIQQGARRAGRSLRGLPLISRANLVLADSSARARERMRPWIAAHLWSTHPEWRYHFNYTPAWHDQLRPLREFIEAHGGKPRNIGDLRLVNEYAHVISDDMVRDAALAGTVDDIVPQIAEIGAMGVTGLALYPMPLEGQTMEDVVGTFVEDVMPRVRRLRGTREGGDARSDGGGRGLPTEA